MRSRLKWACSQWKMLKWSSLEHSIPMAVYTQVIDLGHLILIRIKPAMFSYSQYIPWSLSCQLKSFFMLSLSSLSGALRVQLFKICASWVFPHLSVQKASMRHASMKASVQYFFMHPFAFLCSRWPTLAGVLQEDVVGPTVCSCPQRCFLMMLMMTVVTYNSPWSAIKTGHSFLIQARGFLPWVFFFFFFFPGPGLYTVSFYSVCSLCFIFWKTPSS